MNQETIDNIEKDLNGWTLALISKGKHGVRLQLQSNPPEEYDPGTIKCITAATLEEATSQAIKFTKIQNETD